MPAKKKPASDELVAKVAIAIEGRHFDAGAPIKGVSDEELNRAVASRRVITFAEYEGKDVPADIEEEPEGEQESSTEGPAQA